MTRRFGWVLGIGCALLTMGTALAALPDDIVPRGDIAYDLLGSLASAGKVPGITVADLLRDDRLYTRRELAALIGTIRAESVSESQAAQLRGLSIEFAPELRALGLVPFQNSKATGALSTLLKVRAGAEPVSGDLIGRAGLTSPVGRDGYAALSLGNYRDEWYPLRPRTHDFPAVETVFVRYNTPILDIIFGKMPLRWGPGYSGGLLLNDTAPSVAQLRFEKGFELPGSLGRRIGRIYFTQFGGQFADEAFPNAADDATGTRRYLFGRRLETAGAGGPWKLSLAETFKSTRLPGVGWPFVLPFYAYQDAFTDEPNKGNSRPLGFITNKTYPNTAWFNYMVDAQVTYRVIPNRDASVYTDLLVDDIQAPKGFQGNATRTPRKIGFLLGGYFPRLDSAGRYGARLEYATIDPNTYGSASPPVAYDIGGTPLGYPYGGNSHLFFGRFDARLSQRLQAAAEVSLHRQRDKSQPGAEGDRYSLYANYALRNDLFVGARIDRVTGSERLGNVTTNDATRGEINFGVGF